jgi:hypothetical protein
VKFWLKNFDNYFDKYPLPEAELLKAEETLGYKLPKAYRNLLLEQNGGNIRFNAYKLKEGTTIEHLPFVEFSYIAGVGESEEFGNILHTPEMTEEWNMPKELILINGDGQIWIALDYRNNKEDPAVTYFENESGEDIVIADNFDEFIEGLYIEDDVFFFLHHPDEQEARLLKRSDEEIIEAIQKAVQSKDILVFDDALQNLVINRNDDIAEKYLLELIEHRTLWIRELTANYFYYAAKNKTIDPSILNKAVEKIEKDPALEHFADWIKELEE